MSVTWNRCCVQCIVLYPTHVIIILIQALNVYILNGLRIGKEKILIFISCIKELSIWNKIKYLNLNFFRTRCFKPLIFQTQIIWSNRIHSLKYLRSTKFGSKDIVIRKTEFVAKTQFFLEVIKAIRLVFLKN